MLVDFSRRSDDELLHLASERRYMTAEGVAALDAELRRRNLTESDRIEYQKFVKRQERREWSRHRSKMPTPGLKKRLGWRDILEAFATMALISFTYIELPARYHLQPDWEEAAAMVMISSVVVIFAAASWRKIAFWISLGISSTVQLAIVHTWTRRIRDLSRGQGRGAAFLGLILFLVVHGGVRFLQKTVYGKQTPDRA
jgi:cell division protein FtsW (lipid II flippase)